MLMMPGASSQIVSEIRDGQSRQLLPPSRGEVFRFGNSRAGAAPSMSEARYRHQLEIESKMKGDAWSNKMQEVADAYDSIIKAKQKEKEITTFRKREQFT